MKLAPKYLIVIAVILSLTLVGVIALTRNTDTEIDIQLGGDKSVNIRGKRSPSLSKQTKVDCLPKEDSSQLLDCDSQ